MTNTNPTDLQALRPMPDVDGFYRNGFNQIDERPKAFVPSPECDTFAFDSIDAARTLAIEWRMPGFWRIKASA